MAGYIEAERVSAYGTGAEDEQAAAAAAKAIRASGAIVRVAPAAFLAILGRTAGALLIVSHGGLLHRHIEYLTSYKGFIFYTKTDADAPLALPSSVERIDAEAIWLPD